MAEREEHLDAIIQDACDAQVRRRAMVHLEAAIGSLLDGHSLDETVTILREQADHLETLG